MEKYIGIFNSSFSKYTVLDISFIVIFFSIIQLISLEIFMYRVFQESIVMDKTVISFFGLIQSITEMNKVEFVFRLKKKKKLNSLFYPRSFAHIDTTISSLRILHSNSSQR